MFFPRCHHKLLPSFLPSRLGSNATYHIRHFYSFSFDWRTVALQCYNGFCLTSTWIGHRYTYALSLLNSSSTSLPIPLQTLFLIGLYLNRIFLVAQMVKNLPAMIPGSERSPGEGNGNPLQYSCLENPMDPGAWQAMGSQKSQTQLSD